MGSTYGTHLKFTIFGQSHSPAIGVTIEGIPAGSVIDMDALQDFLSRRAPGNSPLSTPRKEADIPQFLSGLVGNTTCGAPLTAIIPNTNTRPVDYDALREHPRPGHADYTAQMKWGGFQDVSGGGHFSGRLTAPMCIVGGICQQLLEREGITVAAHIHSVGTVQDRSIDPVGVTARVLRDLRSARLPVFDKSTASSMEAEILRAKAAGDSIGGVIECCAVGLPAGLGDPMFGGMENRISQIIFGIPAVRGIEFGTGFAAAAMLGSQHNDAYYYDGISVKTKTNHHGGILGGITSAMPLIFRVAIKPTPSIGIPQETVSLSKKEDYTLTIQGRHDPCIVPRAVPCVEAAAAAAIYDAYLESRKRG